MAIMDQELTQAVDAAITKLGGQIPARVQLAAMILQGLIAHRDAPVFHMLDQEREKLASKAFDLADALLIEGLRRSAQDAA